MFEFKRANEKEMELIQDIAQKTWPETYGEILSKEQLTYMLNLMYSKEALRNQFTNGNLFYFIYKEQELAGFASLQLLDNDTIKLDKIYILPHYQGYGAGNALLQFVINKARSLHATQLVLNVNKKNKAQEFYRKNGFIITGEKNTDIGSGYFMNDYIMCLRLVNL